MTSNDKISDLLREAYRPVFIWGAGMRPYRDKALALARSLGVPVACSWGAIDLINRNDSLNAGGFGTHGTRTANFAVQNADLLIVLGCRLDTKSTGSPPHFARSAKIVMVDIDQAEIDKFIQLGRPVDVPVYGDVGEFLDGFKGETRDLYHWRRRIEGWKELYTPTGPAYDLMRRIGEYTRAKDIIVSDTGNTLGWIMQGFPFKGERFIHAFNFTPMGYGLGAAIGASFASKSRVICIVGDGGALMSINELATIRRHRNNIAVILLNNKGHSMCRHTQRQWLGGTYPATSIEGGLGFPDWKKTAEAFGFLYQNKIDYLRPESFTEIEIDPDESLATQARYGAPIEDMEPALPWITLQNEMIVKPLERK